MKIVKIESLHADAGTRDFDFLKLTTDTGLVGWSEYNETFGGPGLSAVIERLAPAVIGKDPRAWSAGIINGVPEAPVGRSGPRPRAPGGVALT
ncbi:MAG: hypothetical protein HY724_02910 [Candidatus Rokubacteria bacterium]|nr:hypothetical protein [Candidatus Rokubacteria bacterium]